MLRWLLALVAIVALLFGTAFVVAGRTAPPVITIDRPERLVGQQTDLQVSVAAPGGALTTLTIALEQNGRTIPLFALDAPQSAQITQDADTVRVVRPFGKAGVPELQPGAATLKVAATRASFLNLRQRASETSRPIEVRLDPPRVTVVSSKHYVNHGGSEMVVYRAVPSDVQSGVRVGAVEYPGFPAAGAGVANADPSLKVAFFALLHDQDLRTPIVVFARDDAGNEATASGFIDNVFPKPFKRSRIQVDDRFLGRVVPAILEHSPEITSGGDLLADFLQENGPLRRLNAAAIEQAAAATSPTKLWDGAFTQLGGSQVEASFADHRTYVYGNKEVDQQTHLGFDLASTANAPIAASNSGIVVHASWLGIYGNCVIIDHGMGIASLYGHLSSFDVKVGDRVSKGQVIGRSGMTGMAGGDHLHFTMLVGGHPVNPVEWWDAHWVEDRIERKLRP